MNQSFGNRCNYLEVVLMFVYFHHLECRQQLGNDPNRKDAFDHDNLGTDGALVCCQKSTYSDGR